MVTNLVITTFLPSMNADPGSRSLACPGSSSALLAWLLVRCLVLSHGQIVQSVSADRCERVRLERRVIDNGR